jgi:type II secretory ATPase GspE/PulE/Tfp pilus assembly ATPase PilB-like protein
MIHVAIRSLVARGRLAVLTFVFALIAWQIVGSISLAAAGDGWPYLDEAARARGSGGFLSIWKIALAWLAFLAWVKTSDWASRDCYERRLNPAVWNSIVVFPFFFSMILLWIVPSFWIGFPVLVASHLVPLLIYVAKRNPMVMDDEKVLSIRHFKSFLAGAAKPVGVKIQVDKIDPRDENAELTIIPGGLGSERDERVNLMRARQSIGFAPVRRLISEALVYRADCVAVDLLPQSTEVRFQVDGVWHPFQPEDVPTGAAMVDVLKLISGLDVDEHTTKQIGRCALDFRKTQYNCQVVAEMAKTGERAVLFFESEKKRFSSLADLGMRDKTQQAIKEALARKKGLVLFSSLPKQGQTTTLEQALLAADRLMREVYAIEEKNRREREIENITVVTYDAAAKQSPGMILPPLLRKYPDVLVVRDWADGESATALCQVAGDDKLVVGSLAARDAVEAMLRVLHLRVPPATFAKAITVSVSQRLLRKLCDQCKAPYLPMPEELKQFGIPEGRIEQLYRPPRPDPTAKKKRDIPICPNCSGIGYVGRTAVYELVSVDDEMRRLLVEQPKMDVLRAAARRAKTRTLLEEAVLLAASGATSLEEVVRVFKAQ